MSVRTERIDFWTMIEKCRSGYLIASTDAERMEWLKKMQTYLDVLIKLYE